MNSLFVFVTLKWVVKTVLLNFIMEFFSNPTEIHSKEIKAYDFYFLEKLRISRVIEFRFVEPNSSSKTFCAFSYTLERIGWIA